MKSKRVTNKYVIAIGDVGDPIALPVGYQKHIFQTSTAITITPVLFSGSDGTAQAIVAGETWETAAPLSAFKASAIGTVYVASDIE